MVEFINLDFNSRIPKYLQLTEAIIHNIFLGNLKIGDKIPSINKLSEEFYLSRNTVERAYKELINKKVLASYPGKGTFVAQNQLKTTYKIFFLVNKLSPFKMEIYNSFVKNLGENYNVDLHSYHCDESLFLDLIEKGKSNYDYFVVFPHFRTKDLQHTNITELANNALNSLPKDKLILLDNKDHKIENALSEVYQEYENDIISSLDKGSDKLSKYTNLTLVYPKSTFYPYPSKIKTGFIKYCAKHKFDFKVIEEVNTDTEIEENTLYITIEEEDLVNLVHKVRESNFTLGKNVGLISYNDTSLKKLLGISVLTTNFKKMGKKTAKLIKEGKRDKIKIPFKLIARESI